MCQLLALLGAHHILHVNRIRVKVFYLDAIVTYIENSYSIIRINHEDANSFAIILDTSKITHEKNKYYSTHDFCLLSLQTRTNKGSRNLCKIARSGVLLQDLQFIRASGTSPNFSDPGCTVKYL
jgi:hypothetical protein